MPVHESIVITSEFENVLLEPADGDAIELEYWAGNCQHVSLEDTDGVLKIDVDSQPMEGVMIDLSPSEAGGVDDTSTVVRVPASFTGEIEVHSDSGDVVATNVHRLAGLRASNNNGDVVAKNVSATKLDAINENGDTLLSGVEADAILTTNFNGDISPRGADNAARTIGVNSSLGDIQINFTSK